MASLALQYYIPVVDMGSMPLLLEMRAYNAYGIFIIMEEAILELVMEIT
jgi:hypothetical protein